MSVDVRYSASLLFKLILMLLLLLLLYVQPIWTKIYPQQDGIPVANKSGRYWVKLYYLGKERKIEIDDKMPVNFKG